MEALLSSLFGALGGVAKLLDDKLLLQHSNRIAELDRLITAEKNRGYNSDDAQIEAWQKEIKIETDAYNRQVLLLIAARKS